jgi:hypothetical protein
MTTDYIHELNHVRAAAVEKRREVVRDSVETAQDTNDPNASAGQLAEIQKIQIEIEALDRAIADETERLPTKRK